MSIKTLVNTCILASGLKKRSKVTSEPPNIDRTRSEVRNGEITVLTITSSKRLDLTLETIANNQGWTYLSSESWPQALAVIEARTTGIVLLDQNYLGTDWRDLLQILLLPAHRCCVILIASGANERLLEEFIQDGGFKTLPSSISEPNITEVVLAAWDFWTNRIKRVYRYS